METPLSTCLETETQLIQAGRWIIFSGQSLGLLPLKLEKSPKTLNLSANLGLSYLLGFTCSLAMSVFCIILFIVALTSLFSYSTFKSTFKEWILLGIISLEVLCLLLMKVVALFTRKRIHSFWKLLVNCNSVAVELERKLGHEKSLNYFRDTKRNRNDHLWMVLPHIVYLVYCLQVFLNRLLEEDNLFDLHNNMSLIITWTNIFTQMLTTFYFTCYIHWFIFVIELHNIAWKSLVKSLKGINDTLSVNKSMEQEFGFVVKREKAVRIKHKQGSSDEKLSYERFVDDILKAEDQIEHSLETFNETLGFLLGFGVCHDLEYTISEVYYALVLNKDYSMSNLMEVVYIVVILLSVYKLCSESQKIMNNVVMFAKNLENIQTDRISDHLKFKIQLKSHRLSSNPLTVGKWFALNYNFFFSVVGTIATYFVVILQLRD